MSVPIICNGGRGRGGGVLSDGLEGSYLVSDGQATAWQTRPDWVIDVKGTALPTGDPATAQVLIHPADGSGPRWEVASEAVGGDGIMIPTYGPNRSYLKSTGTDVEWESEEQWQAAVATEATAVLSNGLAAGQVTLSDGSGGLVHQAQPTTLQLVPAHDTAVQQILIGPIGSVPLWKLSSSVLPTADQLLPITTDTQLHILVNSGDGPTWQLQEDGLPERNSALRQRLISPLGGITLRWVPDILGIPAGGTLGAYLTAGLTGLPVWQSRTVWQSSVDTRSGVVAAAAIRDIARDISPGQVLVTKAHEVDTVSYEWLPRVVGVPVPNPPTRYDVLSHNAAGVPAWIRADRVIRGNGTDTSYLQSAGTSYRWQTRANYNIVIDRRVQMIAQGQGHGRILVSADNGAIDWRPLAEHGLPTRTGDRKEVLVHESGTTVTSWDPVPVPDTTQKQVLIHERGTDVRSWQDIPPVLPTNSDQVIRYGPGALQQYGPRVEPDDVISDTLGEGTTNVLIRFRTTEENTDYRASATISFEHPLVSDVVVTIGYRGTVSGSFSGSQPVWTSIDLTGVNLAHARPINTDTVENGGTVTFRQISLTPTAGLITLLVGIRAVNRGGAGTYRVLFTVSAQRTGALAPGITQIAQTLANQAEANAISAIPPPELSPDDRFRLNHLMVLANTLLIRVEAYYRDSDSAPWVMVMDSVPSVALRQFAVALNGNAYMIETVTTMLPVPTGVVIINSTTYQTYTLGLVSTTPVVFVQTAGSRQLSVIEDVARLKLTADALVRGLLPASLRRVLDRMTLGTAPDGVLIESDLARSLPWKIDPSTVGYRGSQLRSDRQSIHNIRLAAFIPSVTGVGAIITDGAGSSFIRMTNGTIAVGTATPATVLTRTIATAQGAHAVTVNEHVNKVVVWARDIPPINLTLIMTLVRTRNGREHDTVSILLAGNVRSATHQVQLVDGTSSYAFTRTSTMVRMEFTEAAPAVVAVGEMATVTGNWSEAFGPRYSFTTVGVPFPGTAIMVLTQYPMVFIRLFLSASTESTVMSTTILPSATDRPLYLVAQRSDYLEVRVLSGFDTATTANVGQLGHLFPIDRLFGLRAPRDTLYTLDIDAALTVRDAATGLPKQL